MGKDQELLQAVKTEDLLTVQKLLQRPRPGKAKLLGSTKKVNVNFQDTDGFSPLHHAALNGNLELISILLESQAAVDIRDQKGMRPLHYAAWQGKAEPMKMLLKSGSSVNGQSDEGQIPLHLSAQHGHYDVSEMLLQHQSNPCIVDNAGKTPLDLACEFGRVGVVQLLLSSNMCAALLEPKKGDTTDPNGTSPLHLAAKNGHIDIIRLLIQAGIDINRQTKAGTALHEAALCGKTEVVRLLLESGINATVRNTYSQTALDIVYQFTATQASREIKQLLREASAALQVRALKDYCNNYDLTSLNIKAGDVITVLEQHPDGRWKGCIHDNRTGNDRVGYFPSTLVEVISKRTGEWAGLCAHGSVRESWQAWAWRCRKKITGGDRSSVGSSGSVTSLRSSGSGQSAGSAPHILHAQAEGVKVPHKLKTHLTTVLASLGVVLWCYLSLKVRSIQLKMYKCERVKREESKITSEAVVQWLSDFQLQVYAPNFLNAGYDLPTISRMTPEDLTAIGITKPGHRKKIATEINKLSVTEWLPEQKPNNLEEWLSAIGLSQYHQVLVQNGYENIDFITDITWEDLQEIGITKLGHQKKLMLAVKKLAELQRVTDGRGSPRKKPPPITQQQEVMSIDSPPPEGKKNYVMSPKMSTFQDSELSPELQNAMTQPRQEVKAQRVRTLSKDYEETTAGGGGGPPKKEARTMRQQSSQGSTSSHRGSVSSQGKHRHSHSHSQPAPPYTPPHTPTKTRTSSSSSTSSVQSTASPQPKSKPSQELIQEERPQAPRSHPPQSPTHRGAPCQLPQQQQHSQIQLEQQHHPQAMDVRETQQAQVPLLCLPPEAELAEEEDADPSLLQKKRAHSLNRHAVSDGECDERPNREEREAETPGGQGPPVMRPEGGKYATVTHRVSRSHSVRNQDKGGNRNHTQTFALRQKKKGPPPPPPKRSSSAISSSSSNLTEANTQLQTLTTTGGMLDVPYHQQRRASDLGVSVEATAVETTSMGSVRSIAAMLEMSSIGGGAKGPVSYILFNRPANELLVFWCITQVGKTRDAIGLDGEVVNRRRTISGPVTELVEAARRGSSSSSENLPFAEEGSLTIRRQGREEGEGQRDAGHTPEDRVESTATLKRRPRSSKSHPNGSDFILQESSTVKRRPKSRDKEPEGYTDLSPVPYQNGTATVKRCQPSDAVVSEPQPQNHPQQGTTNTPHRDSVDHGAPTANEGGPLRKPKPPVSPKPVVAQIKRQGTQQNTQQAVPNKKIPLPGKKIPPPVSPKPAPPPTAPKPAKLIHSMTSPSSPTTASVPVKQHSVVARQTSSPPTFPPSNTPSPPNAKPTSPSPQSPHTPQTPTTPQTGIAGGAFMPHANTTAEFGVDSLVHQKLEETSASLAAALQAVEDKILRQEDSVAEQKTTVSILDDIGSMFDDLADQLDAMLE
uniref:CASK interacting protein 1 n=1 Tax=Oryzias melastigma TaxID=30732 RepID=A0A3B3DWQ5_ORYME